jgi:hypothetical protein
VIDRIFPDELLRPLLSAWYMRGVALGSGMPRWFRSLF